MSADHGPCPRGRLRAIKPLPPGPPVRATKQPTFNLLRPRPANTPPPRRRGDAPPKPRPPLAAPGRPAGPPESVVPARQQRASAGTTSEQQPGPREGAPSHRPAPGARPPAVSSSRVWEPGGEGRRGEGGRRAPGSDGGSGRQLGVALSRHIRGFPWQPCQRPRQRRPGTGGTMELSIAPWERGGQRRSGPF